MPKEEIEIPSKEELLALKQDEEQAVDDEPVLSEIEQEAMKLGWNPEGVEGKRNLSAEEFIDRKKLYDDIHSLKRANKRQQEQYDALKQHYDHVKEVEREKVINELKVLKSQALEEQNYDAVVEIDEKLVEARQKPVEQQKQINEAFVDWKQDNSWYDTNSEMREYADMIGAGYYGKNQDKDMKDVYAYVTKEVKLRFPDHFQQESRERPTMVEGSQRGRKAERGLKYTEKDIPEEDRVIMNTLVRNKVLTKEQYIKSYFGLD